MSLNPNEIAIIASVVKDMMEQSQSSIGLPTFTFTTELVGTDETQTYVTTEEKEFLDTMLANKSPFIGTVKVTQETIITPATLTGVFNLSDALDGNAYLFTCDFPFLGANISVQFMMSYADEDAWASACFITGLDNL